jgi:hypothetical protein
MKKSTYKKYLICLVIAFLTLPPTDIWAVRYFSLSDAETFALSFPTITIMFFGLVFAGMLSENLKD